MCLGTACYVRGGLHVLDAIKDKLGIDVGETTEDRMFSLEVARCFGACGLAPAVSIDDEVHRRVRAAPRRPDARPVLRAGGGDRECRQLTSRHHKIRSLADLQAIKDKTQQRTPCARTATTCWPPSTWAPAASPAARAPCSPPWSTRLTDSGRLDVRVTTSGCIGLCEREPVMTVEMLDQPKVIYGDLDRRESPRDLARAHHRRQARPGVHRRLRRSDPGSVRT